MMQKANSHRYRNPIRRLRKLARMISRGQHLSTIAWTLIVLGIINALAAVVLSQMFGR
jgi:hypothetical protein